MDDLCMLMFIICLKLFNVECLGETTTMNTDIMTTVTSNNTVCLENENSVFGFCCYNLNCSCDNHCHSCSNDKEHFNNCETIEYLAIIGAPLTLVVLISIGIIVAIHVVKRRNKDYSMRPTMPTPEEIDARTHELVQSSEYNHQENNNLRNDAGPRIPRITVTESKIDSKIYLPQPIPSVPKPPSPNRASNPKDNATPNNTDINSRQNPVKTSFNSVKNRDYVNVDKEVDKYRERQKIDKMPAVIPRNPSSNDKGLNLSKSVEDFCSPSQNKSNVIKHHSTSKPRNNQEISGLHKFSRSYENLSSESARTKGCHRSPSDLTKVVDPMYENVKATTPNLDDRVVPAPPKLNYQCVKPQATKSDGLQLSESTQKSNTAPMTMSGQAPRAHTAKKPPGYVNQK